MNKSTEDSETVISKKLSPSDTWLKYPIIKRILTKGIERLSEPLELVISEIVMAKDTKKANPIK